MTKEEPFEEVCRLRFLSYCDLHKRAKYHSMKRKYADRAWDEIDLYLTWLEIQSL